MHDLNAYQDLTAPSTLTVRHDGTEQLWYLHTLHDQNEAALPAVRGALPVAVSGIILDHPRSQGSDAL